MAYLIDTNIAIHATDGTEAVLNRLTRHAGDVMLSALSLVELERGVEKHPRLASARRRGLMVLLRYIPVVPFDQAAATAYGHIIAQCGWARSRDFDRMIAGHAISTSSVLITDNTVDFRDIPNLKMENWTIR